MFSLMNGVDYQSIWLIAAAIILSIILSSISMRIQSRERTLRHLSTLPQGALIVALGCPVLSRNGEPNRYFMARIATSAAAYHQLARGASAGMQEQPTLLCSGWDERGEVTEMARQLLQAKVPADCIEFDSNARRTIDSTLALAARSVSQPIILVSQDFHLPRALFLARGFGLDAWGLPAKGELTGLRPRLREALARLRAIFDLISQKRARPRARR